MSQLLILDPRPPVPEAANDFAPRLATLDNVVIGLIHNGKTHGRELMEMIVDDLRERWAIADVVHIGPPSPGYGGNPDDAKPAAEAIMAAISAVGD